MRDCDAPVLLSAPITSCSSYPSWIDRKESMAETKLLVGPNVRLTALGPDDLPALARWYEDVEFLRLFDAVPAAPRAQGALREWLDERQKARDGFLFGVRLHDGDELIGVVEL